MAISDTIVSVRSRVKGWRQKNELIALVPTMGNLHQGHLSLVKRAKDLADRVVVSIFVNPLQFNDKDDLTNYPRTLEQDINLLSEFDVDLIFTPNDSIMYPNGLDEVTHVYVPGMDDKLCGLSRPGHFDGVATIVTKLFNMVQPDIAVFGEKDYQQLMLIKKMVSDLNLAIDIIASATEREETGLAMSSRNGLLSKSQYELAPNLYKQLITLKSQIETSSCLDLSQALDAFKLALKSIGMEVEYIDVRRAEDLALADLQRDTHLRILTAARLGQVRLIDNIACDLA